MDGSKVKGFFVGVKRFLFFVLLIILTPVLIIEGIVKMVAKSNRRKEWKQKPLDGHKLILECGITEIDLMEGYMFEEYLSVVLFYLGYKVRLTQKSRDYGADLILTDPATNQTTVVQAKRYNKATGIKCVQEVIGARQHYRANDAWVVSTSTFTPAAESLAKENGVRLIDRKELIEMYSGLQADFKLNGQDGNLYISNVSLQDKYPYFI